MMLGREALLCIGLTLAAPAFATPPPDLVPNPEMQAWFKSLKQPLSRSPCCNISDCRIIDFTFREGHYEVAIEGWSYVVPTETILDGAASPIGGAVVCYTYSAFGLPVPTGVLRHQAQDIVEILCFVPPRPTS
jgi:hypothetical protein